MKKTGVFLALSLLLILFIINNAFGAGAVKIGLDLEGDHDRSRYDQSSSEDVDTGFSLSGELFASLNKNIDLGGGTTWQFPRSLKSYDRDFYFIPIYGLIRLRSSSERIAPYGTVQAGYNFYFVDSSYKGSGSLDGGLYCGIGGEIIFSNKFEIGLLYSVNSGNFDRLGISYDVEYSKISLMFGYNF